MRIIRNTFRKRTVINLNDTTKTKRLGDISDVVTMSNTDKFVIIVNGQEWLISKANLQKVFTGLSSDDYAKINKIVIDGNGVKFLNDKGEYADITTLFNQDQFVKNASGLIELSGYHTHSNQENILEKFTVDDSGDLLFNGELINPYTLPIASTDTLGGIKVDGITITIDENGVIHGANTYKLPTASDTVLGGVKVDGDTIKINDGVISADVIGNWSTGTSYPVGYFVVYDNKLYQCINANSDTEWTESNWTPIGSTDGIGINNWSANTLYKVGNLVINETTLYQCNTEHTSGETFDETESANWIVLSGEKGDKGYSPAASVAQTDTGCTITVTDALGTTTANLINGTDGVSPVANVTPTENGCVVTVTDSSGTTTANLSNGITPHIDVTTKHWFIGDVDTGIIAEGVTTISSTSVTYTGTLSIDGWVGDTAPYTQDVTISGITSDLSPFIDLIVSDDVATSDKEISQWSYITKATTGDNIITFRCNKTKPTIELNFKVKVV